MEIFDSKLHFYCWLRCSSHSPGYFTPKVQTTLQNYVCFTDDDDDTLVQLTHPSAESLLKDSKLIGSLFCFYGNSRYNSKYQKMALIWNPCIRKSVAIPLPNVLNAQSVLVFGVSPLTNDPTIVKISYGGAYNTIPWLLEIFTLTSRNWTTKRIHSPRDSINLICSHVSIDRFIYCSARESVIVMDGNLQTVNAIISFDMTTQEFQVVDLPHCLSHQFCISLSKLRDSLAVLQYTMNDLKQVWDVWVMDHGVKNSFTKLYTIDTLYAYIKTLGFRNNGEPIIETQDDNNTPSTLVSYEPNSGHVNHLPVYGKYLSFFMGSYTETLLLLDHSDCGIYSNID